MAGEWPLAHDLEQLIARKTNGRVWELLGKADRTTDEDDQMVLSACASLYHWSQAGTRLHMQRGHWLLSRVHAVLGDAVLALRHAEQCFALTQQLAGSTGDEARLQDFDRAYAHEALARALALGGNPAASEHLDKARELGALIANQEDRACFFSDLDTPPIDPH